MNSKRRKPLCIAHRGAFVEAPENTLKSFKLAMEMGADMIELDVRLTKDRKVVVIHDDTIDRTSNGSGAVRDYTLDELKQFDFGEGEKIPTLEEVFELIKGNVLDDNVIFPEKITLTVCGPRDIVFGSKKRAKR